MKNSTKVQVHVGSLRDMANRFTNAWNDASKGIEVNETHITFLDVHNDVNNLITGKFLSSKLKKIVRKQRKISFK